MGTLCTDKNYKNPPVTQVIARLDFLSPIDSLGKNISSKLVKSVSGIFPIAEPQDAIGHQFQIGTEGASAETIHQKNWKFFSKSREKVLTINVSSVFVEYAKYTSFEDFYSEFSQVLDAIEKAFPGTMGSRFGIRYINNVQIQSLEMAHASKFIDKSLLVALEFTPAKNKMTRIFNIVELKDDDISVRFQFGIPNADYPAIIKAPDFILDIDAYAQVAHSLAEAKQYMVASHDIIQDIFEHSITDALRERFDA